MIEGKQNGWEHKRKARDKANLRLVKHRHLIVPAFALLIVAVVSIISAVLQDTNVDAGPIAVVAILMAVVIFGPVIVKGLSND